MKGSVGSRRMRSVCSDSRKPSRRGGGGAEPAERAPVTMRDPGAAASRKEEERDR